MRPFSAIGPADAEWRSVEVTSAGLSTNWAAAWGRILGAR